MATKIMVFKYGGKKAVRIPRSFRLDTDIVILVRTKGGWLIAPAATAKGTARDTLKTSGHSPRRPGFLKGIKSPSDFDAPLPESLIDGFGQI